MKRNRILLPVAAGLLLLIAVSVIAGEPAHEAKSGKKPAESASEKPKASGAPIAVTMEALQELEERKASLDERQRLLDEKAAALDIQEKLLRDKLKRMEELRLKMSERLDGFKKEHEEKIVKLVTVVEAMKPQAAAEYVENLEPELAVAILARIQVAKAAKILNLVDKKKGARLTELYTGYREAGESSSPAMPPPAASPPAASASPGAMGKGGESEVKKM